MLTAEEVAQYLHVPLGTIRAWRRNGTGPRGFVIHGANLRFRRDDVDAWLETQADQPS